jgi:2-dehydro-3-deoxygalactonokinase
MGMIAVDWGTSSFRAYRLDDAGRVLEHRSAAAGLLACQGAFEPVLARQLEGWKEGTILMAGMVGSRNGWREVPYVAAPAGVDELAAGLCRIEAASLGGRRVFIAPGMSHQPPDGTPEVMRGEETQALGLLDQLAGTGPHTVCLPGTHSKWVTLQGGRVTGLRTAMTGELYALLRRHSLLAALMPPVDIGDGEDLAAFQRGVEAGKHDGGLLNHLFGVRTQGLFGTLEAAEASSYLSGLLIGHELRGLMPPGTEAVHLVGAAGLLSRYALALSLMGVQCLLHGETLTARGLFLLGKTLPPAG